MTETIQQTKPCFDYSDFVMATKQFAAAYRQLRDPDIRINLPADVQQFAEFHADILRQLLTEYGATFRISQQEHSFTYDDGKTWTPTTIETVYIDWEHYTYHLQVKVTSRQRQSFYTLDDDGMTESNNNG